MHPLGQHQICFMRQLRVAGPTQTILMDPPLVADNEKYIKGSPSHVYLHIKVNRDITILYLLKLNVVILKILFEYPA